MCCQTPNILYLVKNKSVISQVISKWGSFNKDLCYFSHISSLHVRKTHNDLQKLLWSTWQIAGDFELAGEKAKFQKKIFSFIANAL